VQEDIYSVTCDGDQTSNVSEMCIDIVFKLSLEHGVFTDLTLVCITEQCQLLCDNITF